MQLFLLLAFVVFQMFILLKVIFQEEKYKNNITVSVVCSIASILSLLIYLAYIAFAIYCGNENFIVNVGITSLLLYRCSLEIKELRIKINDRKN